VAPIVRRGVLLDIAGFEGVDVLPASFEVTPDHLSRASSTEINEGDVVLLRTGWGNSFLMQRDTSTTRSRRGLGSKRHSG
jgi:hypothetical protein